MSLFHDILSQLQEKIAKETANTEAAAQVISGVLHTTITKEQVSIHGTTLRLKVSPTLKMALMLQKEKLLTALRTAGFDINTIQ